MTGGSTPGRAAASALSRCLRRPCHAFNCRLRVKPSQVRIGVATPAPPVASGSALRVRVSRKDAASRGAGAGGRVRCPCSRPTQEPPSAGPWRKAAERLQFRLTRAPGVGTPHAKPDLLVSRRTSSINWNTRVTCEQPHERRGRALDPTNAQVRPHLAASGRAEPTHFTCAFHLMPRSDSCVPFRFQVMVDETP
jgi:hypothetical protein